jgi:hypothetical protein
MKLPGSSFNRKAPILALFDLIESLLEDHKTLAGMGLGWTKDIAGKLLQKCGARATSIPF